MKRLIIRSGCVASILILVFCGVCSASAEDSGQGEGWEFLAELYFWGASIGGKSASGSAIDVDLDDILDNLKFAFMGAAGVRKGKWSLIADVIYLSVEDSDTIRGRVPVKVELDGWIVTPFVGYNLVDTESIRLDVLGGARYLNLEANLSLGRLRANASGSNWDGIIGVKGGVNLTEKWYLPYYLDIGAGDSEVTWQAAGGVGYRFKWFDLVAMYRYVRWDFDDNRAIDKLYFNGPFFGIKFSF